ncbi:LysR family transcriptional regulator [Bacillus manliponensis]|uniref:HTH-type transcriptional regulator CzcR n=1 Tax=Bacillus manliponensis TaxID=574376 RepID=A0A073KBM6_9BACI|nr:LysR substrate-binding domain-containing protein [Bacillus manliponensis]KEK19708.1 LysR family transcriptional regulator [Bacillus manliponensis]
MDLRQLECFMAVCKELHFTRAAERLNISQPSLSQQIKNLEFAVGTPLFDRIGKKTALTEAGRILLIHSQRIFHEIEQAHSALRDLNGLHRGKLTIGSLLTCVSYLLPPTILDFKRLYPNIELSVFGLRTGEIRNKLLENELDLGIVFFPMKDEEFEETPLFTEELALAVPSNHPFANLKEVNMKAIENVPTVLLPKNYFLRNLIDKYCKELEISIKPTLEMTTMESLVHMVSEGIGVTILPAPYLDSLKNSDIVHVKLINPTPKRDIGIIYRKDKFMCAASRTFIAQLTETSKIL